MISTTEISKGVSSFSDDNYVEYPFSTTDTDIHR